MKNRFCKKCIQNIVVVCTSFLFFLLLDVPLSKLCHYIKALFFYILVIEQNERFTHQITTDVINHNICTFFLSLLLYIHSLWSTFPRDFSFDLILFDVWKCIEFWDMGKEISLFMHYLENDGDITLVFQILQKYCAEFSLN